MAFSLAPISLPRVLSTLQNTFLMAKTIFFCETATSGERRKINTLSCIYTFLGWIMDRCYGLLGNYGWAIVLFTFLTKIILMPLFLWTYFNSITMIKIQPDIDIILIPKYGVMGVAFSNCIVFFLMAAALLIVFHKKYYHCNT